MEETRNRTREERRREESRKRARRRRRRRRSWGRTFLLIAIVAAMIYACVQCVYREPEQKEEPELPPSAEQTDTQREEPPEREPADSHTERKDNFYTILLAGADNDNGGSDTNILLAVDVENKYIHGVSIPRDTKARIKGTTQKINAAYQMGGMELASQVVSEQLGIPVDYSVLVDLKGFQELVNAIGGVDFEVPINMNYDDPYQDLHIHIKAGMQNLDGKEAMGVVRFRHNNDGSGYGSEDIGRMKTQQDFLKAVARQTLVLSNLGKVDEFVKIFQEYVDTDLTLGNMVWLGEKVIRMGAENISFSTLPNVWKSPYIYLEPEETLAMVNGYLNPYVEDRTAEDLGLLPMP